MMLREPVAGPAAWRAVDVADRAAWTLRLSPVHLDEIGAALAAVRRRGLTLLQTTAADFPLPTLAGELARLADEVEDGRGFALVRGLPIARYGEAGAAAVFWGLGRHLGLPVSQNAEGHLLGHVRDTGRVLADPAARGYQTGTALAFHTDGSDALALLCLQPARSGGRIMLASSAALYNSLLLHRPDLVERLYRRFAVDRREEHGPGERAYDLVPLACWYGGELSLRYNRCYLESAQRFADAPRLETADHELFDLIDETAASRDHRLEIRLTAGDLLLVNNYTVLHARDAIKDFSQPGRRHLLRLWLTHPDGRPLPHELWADPERTGEQGGRGAVPPRDVIGRVPPARHPDRLRLNRRHPLPAMETTA
jgi:hypothetical protein